MSNKHEIETPNGTVTVERSGEHAILTVTIGDLFPQSTLLTKEQAQKLGAALLDAMPIRSTRRELFAAAALEGLLSNTSNQPLMMAYAGEPESEAYAREATKLAAALIAALDEKPIT